MIGYQKFNRALQFYLPVSRTEQSLLFSCLFSIGLVFFRVVYTDSILFISMLWNLFLALVPYAISRKVYYSRNLINNGKLLFYVLIWLVFIPNSFYIITDLFHLEKRNDVPLWFDLALLFSVAWNGLLLGILSVRHMERIAVERYGRNLKQLFLYAVMFLNAFGVYLGRYLRYNSWDVVGNPFGLLHDIVYLFIHPVRNRFDWGMIICYSLLMTMIYITLKRTSRVLA